MSEHSLWHKQLVADIHLKRAKLVESMMGLTEEQLTTLPLWEDWTIARLLPHIAAWDGLEAYRIRLAIDGNIGEYKYIPTEKQNAIFHEKYRDLDVHTGIAMLQKERRSFLTVLNSLTDDELKTELDLGDGFMLAPLKWVTNSPDHDIDHANEIVAWRQANGLDKLTKGPKGLVLAYLRIGRKLLKAIIDLIPSNERESRPLVGDWTLKDLISHLAYWETICIEGLRTNIALTNYDFEQMNQDAVATRGEKGFDDVWAEYVSARSATIEYIEYLSEEGLHKPLKVAQGWRKTPYLWTLIYPHHEIEHAEEILRALGQG